MCCNAVSRRNFKENKTLSTRKLISRLKPLTVNNKFSYAANNSTIERATRSKCLPLWLDDKSDHLSIVCTAYLHLGHGWMVNVLFENWLFVEE